jgi:outer membrane protein assembly factor BamB
LSRISACLIVSSLLVVPPAFAENWPEFRGPSGQGLVAKGGLPTEWDTTKNVVWKQELAGTGWSSPVIYDGKIYLTAAVPVENSKDLSLRALCLDAKTGQGVWEQEVFREDAKAPRIHNKNSHASPTPIVDGESVYVHFGHLGTACLDLKGKVLWRNRDLKYSPVHGAGGSPILAGDALVFSCDGGDTQFVVALKRSDGKQLWKTERKTVSSKKFAFATPLLIEVDGKPQIISPGAGAVMAYDPKNGQEIWRVRYGEGYSVIPRPVYGHGLVFLSSGYDSPTLMAIKPTGKSDVTDSHVAWTLKKGAPHTPSPLLVGDELYVVSDGGIASCLDAKTGNVHWQERVPGNYSASPLYADGKVYFQSEQGTGTVVKADKTFEKLAKNDMKERTLASYGVADGAIYLRTEKNLYRIEGK